MIYFNEEFLEIQWDNNVKCVIMTWKTFAEGEDFRTGLDKGLELIIQNKSSKWLADLRKMKVLSKEDQDWSNNDWYPRAVKGGIRKMAIVMPSSVLATIGVKNILTKAGGVNIETTYFGSVEEGLKWFED